MRGKERVGRLADREGTRPLGQTLGVQKIVTSGELKKKSPFIWKARYVEGPRGWSSSYIGRACSEELRSLVHMGPPTLCHSV